MLVLAPPMFDWFPPDAPAFETELDGADDEHATPPALTMKIAKMSTTRLARVISAPNHRGLVLRADGTGRNAAR